MAGSQIVLHPRDDATSKEKDHTRNIGLRSIVNREDAIVNGVVASSLQQTQVLSDITSLAGRMTTAVQNLLYVAETIQTVIENWYFSKSRTQQYVDIELGALKYDIR